MNERTQRIGLVSALRRRRTERKTWGFDGTTCLDGCISSEDVSRAMTLTRVQAGILSDIFAWENRSATIPWVLGKPYPYREGRKGRAKRRRIQT